jgi:hypothetical protein
MEQIGDCRVGVLAERRVEQDFLSSLEFALCGARCFSALAIESFRGLQLSTREGES